MASALTKTALILIRESAKIVNLALRSTIKEFVSNLTLTVCRISQEDANNANLSITSI